MSKSRGKIVRRLEHARVGGLPVTVHRKRFDEDEFAGFVIAVLDHWVVIQDLAQSVYLDDVVILRLDGVTSVQEYSGSDGTYVRRAVHGLGVPLEQFECPRDATAGDLLRVVDGRASLVGVHIEDEDGYWYNFGKIISIGRRRLDFHFVGRDGVWADIVDAWKLEDITRIEFGGRYIRALAGFGEERPTVTVRKKR